MRQLDPRPEWIRSVGIAAWVVLWLAVIDVAVNWAFDRPSQREQPSALSRYFEYGRSVEGKLRRMVAADPARGGQMVGTGWIDPASLGARPAQPAPGHDLLMAVYGPSFAMNAANEAARIDGKITIRGIGGPGAPPSHGYAAYKSDAPLRKADVAVFGVLSSGVGLMGSLSGLIWLFESPAPYTFPRYRVQDGALMEERPVIGSESEFRRAFADDPALWSAFKDQLRRSDRGYDRFTFDHSFIDASSIVRLVRRGWVAHRQPYDEGVYDAATGFNPDSQEVQALKLMLADLQRRSCERGEHLIVLLLHTQRQADHLHAALAQVLRSSRVDYVSTHELFSANDARNFVPDGHYTASANEALARALLKRARGGAASDCTGAPQGLRAATGQESVPR